MSDKVKITKKALGELKPVKVETAEAKLETLVEVTPALEVKAETNLQPGYVEETNLQPGYVEEKEVPGVPGTTDKVEEAEPETKPEDGKMCPHCGKPIPKMEEEEAEIPEGEKKDVEEEEEAEDGTVTDVDTDSVVKPAKAPKTPTDYTAQSARLSTFGFSLPTEKTSAWQEAYQAVISKASETMLGGLNKK
jgi:hypothetical protein